MIILLYSNIAVLIVNSKSRKFNLLNDREFLFKLYKFNTLFIYIYIVNYNIFKIFVRNDINYIIKLPRRIKLDIIINYKINNYYVIDFSQHDLIFKRFK